MGELLFAEQETLRFVIGKSRYVSFHRQETDGGLAEKTLTIFEAPAAVAP